MSKQAMELVAKRYNEALQNPNDIQRWRSLAYMAGFAAENIERHEPGSKTAKLIRKISEDAWNECLALCPPRDEEDHNSLAGVIIGWFRKWRAA